MKRLLLTLLASAFLLISCGMTAERSIPSVIERVNMSLVKVMYNLPEEDATHVCAGFVVNAPRGEVLTARHCVDPQRPVITQNSPLSPVVASQLLKANASFALVSIKSMSMPPLDLRKDTARIGEATIAIGFPNGFYAAFQRHVAAFAQGDFVVDGAFIAGMSGGPVVDLDGKVVGIVQAGNDDIGIACGVGEIRAFLTSKSN